MRPPILAIAAPVRDEAPYLLEWIAHHRALGVSLFLLGDNGGTDETSELLERLAQANEIVRVDWRSAKYFQLAFNAQAIAVARDYVDGLFLIDVDEFLRPMNPAGSLLEACEPWLRDDTVSAVALNWAIFGSSGHRTQADEAVTERFTRRAEQDFPVNRHTKAFVKPSRASGPSGNAHALDITGGRYIASGGADVVWDTTTAKSGISESVAWERLRIDHFVVKSVEEFERKRARGCADHPFSEAQRAAPEYFAGHDRNEVLDPMPPELVRRMKAARAEIEAALARTKFNAAALTPS